MSVKSVLTALADAIRSKSGLTGTMTLEQMTEAVRGIEKGIDTSDATATDSDMTAGETAYVKGKKVTGTLEESYPSSNIGTASYSKSEVEGINIGLISIKGEAKGDVICRKGQSYLLLANAYDFGDAAEKDVVAGKTFTSVNGLKRTGTHECSSSTPTLQSKSVEPSESEQTVSPDDGYDGLSRVTVEAVSNTYVGSGVTKKAAQTYTPGTADQTIVAEQYMTGVQTIKGDSNLVAGNIKSGVSIFGVTGTYEGSGGSGGGIQAQHITSENETITISGAGTVKVWGYGYKSGGYMGTTYSFVGDGYYSGGYGTPRKTSATFSISNGKLSGLPSGLTSLDVLVTIGI